jgi:hypothetical protein
MRSSQRSGQSQTTSAPGTARGGERLARVDDRDGVAARRADPREGDAVLHGADDHETRRTPEEDEMLCDGSASVRQPAAS